VPLDTLRALATWFPTATAEYKLDPSYEPAAEQRDPHNEQIFAELQKCRAAKLLVPVGENHLYFAAMNSKSCKLTALGRHYWDLAKNNQI
jgi:hypothetical protein